MENRNPESCTYRQCAYSHSDEQVATCQLLQKIVGVDEPKLPVVRDACVACCDSYPPSEQDLNPIVASLLFQLTEQIIELGGVQDCDHDKAKKLNRRAEIALPSVGHDEDDSLDIGRLTYEHLASSTVDDIEKQLPFPDTQAEEPIKSWAVGVTTAPRRLPTVETCVQSIIGAGWTDPVLFVDGDVDLPSSIDHLPTCRRKPAIGAFPNYVLSLAELYMRDPHADAYMLIQDDALLLGTPAMREYLEKVLWPKQGPGLASLYCSTKYSQESPGWHLFPETWIWGAVAFVFSPSTLKQFLTSMLPWDHRAKPNDEGLSRIDILIGKFASENEVPIYYPSPSLVQHIGTISTLWKVSRAVRARRADQFIGDLMN